MAGRKSKGKPRGTRESPLEVKFREWKSLLPTNPDCEPLGTDTLVKIFETADELVHVDVERRQLVVSTLSTPGGLQCILELIEIFALEEKRKPALQSAVSSLFFVIGHHQILDSAILQTPLTTIYMTIWEKAETCALGLFAVVEEAGQTFSLEDVEVTLAVLSRFLLCSESKALANEGQSIVRVLEDKMHSLTIECDNSTAVNIRRLLSRSKAPRGRKLTEKLSPSLLSKTRGKSDNPGDGPGDVSPSGRRHDNDFADIRQIRIFPTFQEITSEREPYLPHLDPNYLHLDGTDGLIDRHFRLYREDVIADMRDTIRNIITQQKQPALRSRAPANTAKFNSYQNLVLQRLACDRFEGLVTTVGVNQPREVRTMNTKARESWWNSAGRLQPGVLVCLLDATGQAIFCTVLEQRRKFSGENTNNKAGNDSSHDLSSDPRQAVFSLVLADSKDIQALTELFASGRRGLTLLEFPKIISQTFQPTLAALQSMIGKDDLPFVELLAPKNIDNPGVTVEPPMFTQMKDFEFDLSPLTLGRQPLELPLHGPFDMNILVEGSTLDRKQAEALVHALTRRLALLQGPPGTGKSFISVALLRVLLATKDITNIGPILVVTYTNHALDQTLEHCIDQDITNVIRIGSRSKSERLENMNLRSVAKGMPKTKLEKRQADHQSSALQGKAGSVNEAIQSILEPDNAIDLMEYLKYCYPEYHQQFWARDEKAIKNSFQFKPIASWLQKGRRDDLNPTCTAQELLSRNADAIWQMSLNERKCLYTFWVNGYRANRKEAFYAAMRQYFAVKKLDDAARREVDLRCLAGADIIGMTTSGLARNLDLLKRLPIKVVLVEEAGEILEAHTLTALLPAIEHAILVGDHLQLKPSVERFQLASESHGGKKYSLDLSLFERLVSPPVGIPSLKLPCSTLGTQRRMRPAISSLIRETLYPHLEDDPSVESYPEVTGMRDCLYWLDHASPEQGGGYSEQTSMSKSNDYEVKCVVALATHLLSQGVYRPKDIAVITPYLGQMFRLKTALSVVSEVALDDRDEGQLREAGFIDSGYMEFSEDSKETSLLDALKVATVDNFQGEEAKVVIVSLVRSNQLNQCGFLRTPNRINVLLSRAKHGMYIVGNRNTSAGVPMWAKVLSIFEEQGNIGRSLKLSCPRHPETVMEAFEPADFQRLSPEGGCTLPCDRPLPCGHACKQLCHSDLRHTSVKCLEPCERMKKGCDHPCQWNCGDACEPKCVELLAETTITLACGHTLKDVRCWQRQDQSSLVCNVVLDKHINRCGHTVRVPCHENVQDRDFLDCDTPCGGKLRKCGHICQAPCFACPIWEDGTRNHAACAQCSGYA
ncbi:unnamed protein product [Periconia digitata]|uniref:NFX1-type zinc finger-containing protein 1 n=1 Tax=Periconia digitata TaxID=1303443 RepID=A0A9W4UCH2_9PLEO|nr:unnamed protein product [Periconia digitata]